MKINWDYFSTFLGLLRRSELYHKKTWFFQVCINFRIFRTVLHCVLVFVDICNKIFFIDFTHTTHRTMGLFFVGTCKMKRNHTGCGSHFENHTNFKILKKPLLVQKPTLHQQKVLDISYLEPQGQCQGLKKVS